MPAARPTHRPWPRRKGPGTAALMLALAGVGSAPEGAGAGLPDLVLGRDAIQRAAAAGAVTVRIENRGSAASAPTTLLATDRALLSVPPPDAPLFPRHRLLREERGLVLWPERHPDRFLLRVRWQGLRASGRCQGVVSILAADRSPLAPDGKVAVGRLPASALVTDVAGGVRWDAATGREEAGFDLVYLAAAAPAVIVLERPRLDGVPGLKEVFLGSWWASRFMPSGPPSGEEESEGEALDHVEIPLGDPRLAHVSLPAAPAWRRIVPLPGLAPGGSASVAFEPPAAGSPIFVELDPDDRVAELLEGNNVAHLDQPGSLTMVSLHTHASLSEGTASLDAQMDQLARAGYDAVFWTEHDWLLTGHGLARTWTFDEPPTPRSWWFEPQRLAPGLSAVLAPDPSAAHAGAQGLRLRLEPARGPRPAAGDPPREAAFALRVWRSASPRALAQGLTMTFDLRPDSGNADGAEFLVEVDLSDQPRVRRRLAYRLQVGAEDGPDSLTLPAPGTAPVPRLVSGRWTRIVIPLTEHARAVFPEGEDNSLTSARFGGAVRDLAAHWDVDDLRLELATTGAPALDWQRERARRYPALASHVTSEISWYVPHFTALVDTPILLDYRAVPREQVAAEVERRTHAAGGALSLNHPLGFNAPFPERLVDSQIEYRLYGADLVEIGYRHRAGADLATHLAFWNRALDHGLVATAVGSTDTHGAGRGGGFARDENNFATWIEAEAESTSGLVDALLAGNTTFGDPLLLGRGRLSLLVDEAHSPGAVVIGEPSPHAARGAARDLPPGARLDLVADGQAAATATVNGTGEATVEASLPAATRWVRLEAWDGRGEPLATTNAVAFRGDLPPEGLPLSRLRLATPAYRASGTGPFHVTGLEAGGERLALRGTRGEGSLRIEREGGGTEVHAVVPPGLELGSGTGRAWPLLTALIALVAAVILLAVFRRTRTGAAAGAACLAVVTVVSSGGCARYCPDPHATPEALHAASVARPCGSIEACVLPFWLGTTGTAHAATVAFPLGDAPGQHTAWLPGEVQRWRSLAQTTNELVRQDGEFVRELEKAEAMVRRKFDKAALKLKKRCKVPPGESELTRLGQRITEKVYARTGIYRRITALEKGPKAATSP